MCVKEKYDILRFGVVVVDDSKHSDSSGNTVNSSVLTTDHLNSGTQRMFWVPCLCPQQEPTLVWIAYKPKSGVRLIVVDRTVEEET